MTDLRNLETNRRHVLRARLTPLFARAKAAIIGGALAGVAAMAGAAPAAAQTTIVTIQQVSNGRYADAHENDQQDWHLVTRPAQNNTTQQWRIVTILVEQPQPPQQPPAPVVVSQGGFQLIPQQQVNLDNGAIGPGGADLFYQVVGFTRQLAPINGAQISFTNGAQRGFAGCSAAAFGNGPVLQASLGIGSYVCVRTNQGRVSEFRVDNVGVVLGVLTISYTTWQ